MAGAVVLDLDGTLVDSRADLVASVGWMLDRLGHPARPGEEIAAFVGRGARHLIARSLPEPVAADEAAVDAALALFKEHYAEHLADRTRPYDGVAQALEALSDSGTPLWVLTNKPGDFARRLLEAVDLAPWLDGVLGAGDVPAHKPDPAGLLEACKRAGSSPASTWYVGDLPLDVETARGAGCRAAAVMWGYGEASALRAARPDRVIRRPSDLARLA